MKTLNTYATAAGDDLYEMIPKAVWAALAISALTSGGDYLSEARDRVLTEWLTLHQNGIVPQKPPASFVPRESDPEWDAANERARREEEGC